MSVFFKVEVEVGSFEAFAQVFVIDGVANLPSAAIGSLPPVCETRALFDLDGFRRNVVTLWFDSSVLESKKGLL